MCSVEGLYNPTHQHIPDEQETVLLTHVGRRDFPSVGHTMGFARKIPISIVSASVLRRTFEKLPLVGC